MTYIMVYGFFILCSMGQACVLPYLTMFFKYLGFSAFQAGIIRSAQTLIALCSIPFWLQCTARFNEKNTAIGLNLFLSMATYLSVTTIPPINPGPYFKYCHFNINALPSTSLISDLNWKYSKQNDSIFLNLNKTNDDKKPLENRFPYKKENSFNLLKKPQYLSSYSQDTNSAINRNAVANKDSIKKMNNDNTTKVRKQLLNVAPHIEDSQRLLNLKYGQLISIGDYGNPFLLLTNANRTELSDRRSDLIVNKDDDDDQTSKFNIPWKNNFYYSFNSPWGNIPISKKTLATADQGLPKPYSDDSNGHMRNKVPLLINDGNKGILLKTLFSNQNYGFRTNQNLMNIKKKDSDDLQRIQEDVTDVKTNYKNNDNDNQENYYPKQINSFSIPKKSFRRSVTKKKFEQIPDYYKNRKEASQKEMSFFGLKKFFLNDDSQKLSPFEERIPRKNKYRQNKDFKIGPKKQHAYVPETNVGDMLKKKFPDESENYQNSHLLLPLESDVANGWNIYSSKMQIPKQWENGRNILSHSQKQIYRSRRNIEKIIKPPLKKNRNDITDSDFRSGRYTFFQLQDIGRKPQSNMKEVKNKFKQSNNNFKPIETMKPSQKKFRKRELGKKELSKNNGLLLIKQPLYTRKKRTILRPRMINTRNIDPVPEKDSSERVKYLADVSVKSNIHNIFKVKSNYLRNEIWSQDHLIIFVSILIIFSLGELLGSSYVYLADEAWYQYLDYLDETEFYGANHSWCLMLSAVATFLVSTWVANSNCHIIFGINKFMLYFFTYGAIMGIALVLSMFIPVHSHKVKASPRMQGKYLTVMCEEMDSILCSITTILNGLWIGCIHDFLLWRVAELGGEEYHFGGAVAVGIISDALAPKITSLLKQKLNLQHIISVATFLYGVRFLYFSLLWEPSAVFGGQLLQGFTSGVLQVAMKTQMERKIDSVPRQSALLLHMSFCSSGYVLGTFLSGLLFDKFGPNLMFQIMAITSFLWCAVVSLISPCRKFKNKYAYPRFRMPQYNNVNESTDVEDGEDWLEAALENEIL